MTHTPTALRALLAEHGLEPSRALGQNFVADPNTVRRIVRLADLRPGQRVLEIGAGLGSLTLALVEAGAEVTALELDRHLLPILRSVVEPQGARVVEGDAMQLDWSALLGAPGEADPHVLVANLPYNIATPLLLDLLAGVPQVERMLVMVQLEVGERLAAVPGSKAYGIPSVKLAWWGRARIVGKVPPSVFIPPPRVDSALVDIRRHDPPGTESQREATFALLGAGFGQRRKMLRRSLAGLATVEQLEAANIRPESRAEELTLENWMHLAEEVRADA